MADFRSWFVLRELRLSLLAIVPERRLDRRKRKIKFPRELPCQARQSRSLEKTLGRIPDEPFPVPTYRACVAIHPPAVQIRAWWAEYKARLEEAHTRKEVSRQEVRHLAEPN